MERRTVAFRVFTAADLGGRKLFRAVRLNATIAPGEGRIWLDVSRGNGFQLSWQDHARHLARVGERSFALPFRATDLFLDSPAQNLVLEGASASIPLFVAWIALLSEKPLPEPFLAAGCADGSNQSGAVLSAPREFIQGKLEVAQAIATQIEKPAAKARFWVPSGSAYDAAALPSLEIREVASLQEAALQILGIEPALLRAAEASTL